ncbi:hypothetical protein ACFQ1S_11140, partial [Kibdelosporangium lantanae]
FAGLAFLSCEPKLKFGSDTDQECAKDGTPKWVVQLVAASRNPFGGKDLFTTYSLIFATFLGTMGLPHVLVRFYTNPDGKAARRTTLHVMLLLALFFATFVPLLGAEMVLMNSVGIFNQGRYFLTGAVGLPMLGAYYMARNRLTGDQVSRLTRMFAVILLPFHFVCMVYSLTRYTSGLRSLNPFNGSWQPPYGVILPMVLAVVGIAIQYVVFFRNSKAPAEPLVPEPEEQRTLATVS